MNHILVAILDRALDAYGRPFAVPAIGAAIRSFQDEINNTESPMNKHPEDYDLYQLGMYDDTTGRIHSADEPKQLAIGKQMLVTKGENNVQK